MQTGINTFLTFGHVKIDSDYKARVHQSVTQTADDFGTAQFSDQRRGISIAYKLAVK
jgi:hypothetical protein